MASIREGSTSPEAAEPVLPLLLREAAAAATAALVPGRSRVTLVTPRLAVALGAALVALTVRVAAAAGLLVVLVMGARGSVRPAEAVVAVRRAGTNLPLSAVLMDRVAATVRAAPGSLSLLGPAAAGSVAVERWRLTV